MRRFAPLLFLLLLVPVAGAFTWAGDFNYVTPGGGTLHFAADFTSQTWVNAANQQRWGTTVYGGVALGTVGFDPAACVMTVTNMQLLMLNYTVVAGDVATQRIYYRGLGAPTTVTGGAAATVGTITTVTTNGNTAVGLIWGGSTPGGGTTPIQPEDVINSVPGYLSILVLMLLAFAGVIIVMASRGEFDAGALVAFILVASSIVITIVVIYNLVEAVT